MRVGVRVGVRVRVVAEAFCSLAATKAWLRTRRQKRRHAAHAVCWAACRPRLSRLRSHRLVRGRVRGRGRGRVGLVVRVRVRVGVRVRVRVRVRARARVRVRCWG